MPFVLRYLVHMRLSNIRMRMSLHQRAMRVYDTSTLRAKERRLTRHGTTVLNERSITLLRIAMLLLS